MIKVSLNGINNNITEEFIDKIFIDKANWKAEDDKLVITIPKVIPKGNYTLNFWDERANKYVINNFITIIMLKI